MIIIYIYHNMKLYLLKFTYTFLSLVIIILLASCAILDYEGGENESRFSQNNIKKNKCPLTQIPSKTASYISSKKYVLSIKKIEMACKSEAIISSNVLDIVVQFKAEMELKTNNKIKTKDLMLPSIYIALVDIENEEVLAKMISKIDLKNKEGNLIEKKKKFRFKHASIDNLSIYFGLQ